MNAYDKIKELDIEQMTVFLYQFAMDFIVNDKYNHVPDMKKIEAFLKKEMNDMNKNIINVDELGCYPEELKQELKNLLEGGEQDA